MIPAVMRSPPSATHSRSGSEDGVCVTSRHNAGVLQMWVARVAATVSPNCSFTIARVGRQRVAPATSAVHASPMHGSKETADVRSKRLRGPMPWAIAFASAYAKQRASLDGNAFWPAGRARSVANVCQPSGLEHLAW